MDTIKIGSLPTAYSLVYPPGFSVTPAELYDPDTGGKVENPAPTEYNTSFLVPVADFPLVKQLIRDAINVFNTTDEVTRIPAVVVTTDNVGSESGTFQVFWVVDTYERYHDQVQVTLKGFGESDSAAVAPNQTFTVTEGAASGTVVGTVKGFKPSLTLEGRPDIPFAYQASSGVLSVTGKLDFETNPEWVLTIGGQEVTIWVLDAAENPIAEQSTYTYYLDPSTGPGTAIGTVTATQQGETGAKPAYTLVSGNTGGWAIDSVSGEITYLGGQPLVDGQILGVGYGGSEPLTVTLRVLPSNVITLPILRFNLPPTLTDGMLVGNVGAEGVIASLTDPGFAVSDNKLLVANKSQIESGLSELTLDLKAEGRTGTQSVYVIVADYPKLNEFWVPEDSENGSTIGTVELPDVGGPYVVTPTTLFNINAASGEILVTNASILNPGNYTLTITRGPLTTTATVKVYAVLSSNALELTVAATTPVNTALGSVSGTAPYTIQGAITPYALNATTGEIKLISVPPVALAFTVTDAAGDTTQVAIALEATTTPVGDTGFVGAVYAGQSGQAVATRANVIFSVGSVGFGGGSLNIEPDNLGSTARNTEAKVVASKAPGLQLNISANATPEMITALKALWALPLETLHTLSVPGEDFKVMIVNFKRTYSADGVSVNVETKTN